MPSTDQAVTSPRAAARKAAEEAVGAYVRTAFADAGAFATAAGVSGPARLVIFSGRFHDADAVDDLAVEQAGLVSVTVAGPHRTLRLAAGADAGELWAEAVSLWSDLRESEAMSHGCEAPISLVLGVDDGLEAGYDEYHCATHGPTPTLLGEIGDPDEDDDDPFAALLADTDDYWDELNERLERLMAVYGLQPPTRPDGRSCAGEHDEI